MARTSAAADAAAELSKLLDKKHGLDVSGETGQIIKTVAKWAASRADKVRAATLKDAAAVLHAEATALVDGKKRVSKADQALSEALGAMRDRIETLESAPAANDDEAPKRRAAAKPVAKAKAKPAKADKAKAKVAPRRAKKAG